MRCSGWQGAAVWWCTPAKTKLHKRLIKMRVAPKFDQLVDFARAFILILNARHVSIFTWCECAVNKAKFQFHQQKNHCNCTLERLWSLECCVIIQQAISRLGLSSLLRFHIIAHSFMWMCNFFFRLFFRLLLLFTVAFLYFIVLNFILSPVFHVLFISFCVPVNVPNSVGWVSLICLVSWFIMGCVYMWVFVNFCGLIIGL